MAANLVVVISGGPHKQTVKTTPSMSLKAVLGSVCEKQGLGDPESYSLVHGRHTLDLSLSVRFANLATGAKLDLVRSSANHSRPGSKPAEVTIALQLESGRLVGKFPNTTTLWDILRHFEELSKGTLNLTRRSGPPPTDEKSKNVFQNFFKKHGDKKEVYLQPVCVFTNQEYATIPILKATTLLKAGLSSGNAVVRVLFRFTQATLEETFSEIQSTSPTPTNQPAMTSTHIVSDPNGTKIENTERANQAAGERSDPQPSSTTSKASSGDTQIPTNQAPVASPVSMQKVELQPAQPEPISIDKPETSTAHSGTQAESTNFNASVDSIPRNIRVFRPPPEMGNLSNKIELPDSFFELTSTEIRSLLQTQKARRMAEEQAGFKSSATRAAEEAAKERKHPKTMIRVRFPDRMQLQGEFNTQEPVSAVYEFVAQSISEAGRRFFLYTTPPKQILKTMDISLYRAGLAPATVVFFSWENREVGQSPFLIPALLEKSEDLAVDVLMPDSEPQGSEESEIPTTFSEAGEGHLLTETRTEEEEENVGRRRTFETSELNPKKSDRSPKMPKWLKLGKK